MADVLLLVPKESASDQWDASETNDVKIEPLDLAPGALLSPIAALNSACKSGNEGARILIADLRCTAALAHLREKGYIAERAGNRLFGGDATPDDIAAISGHTLDEQLVGCLGQGSARRSRSEQECSEETKRQAWRRDGWAGLSAIGCPWQEALRWPHNSRHAMDARSVVKETSAHLLLDDLLLAAAPVGANADLAALLQTPWPSNVNPPNEYRVESPCPFERDPGDYEQARCRHAPVSVKPVLLLRHRGTEFEPSQTTGLELLVPIARRAWLARVLQEPRINGAFDLALTMGCYRCRLSAELRPGVHARAFDQLVTLLLDVALVTGRPLREFDCTFYLALDLMTDRQLSGGQPAIDLKHLIAADAEPVTVASPGLAVKTLYEAFHQEHDKHAKDCALSRGDLTQAEAEAQALLYFLPSLQRAIFDSEPEDEDESGGDASPRPLRHWRLPLDAANSPELHVEGPAIPGAVARTAVTAALKEVSLFGYGNELCILALRVGFTDDQREAAQALRGDGDDWWHPLLMRSQRGRTRDTSIDADEATTAADHHWEELQAERWLWFTKNARLLRPAFPQQAQENKIPQVGLIHWSEPANFSPSSKDSFSPVILKLLRAMLPRLDLREGDERLLQVRDDRMFANVAYSLAGPAPGADPQAQDAFERLFSLALYVDHAGDGFSGQDGYAYDKEFVRAQLELQANRRWQGVGSVYGSTNYSHAAVGFGDYFAGPVARVHVPFIHGRMLVLALFFELTLRHFDRRITIATRDIAELDLSSQLIRAGEVFSDVQRRFIRFTNDYWFREVTSQTQGAETFRRITLALRLDEQYALVKDKVERTDQYLEQRRGRLLAESADRLSRKANQIGRWALFLALAALLIGVLAIPSHDPSLSAEQLGILIDAKGICESLGAIVRANWNFVMASAALVAVTVVSIIAVVWAWANPRRTQRDNKGHQP